jgi:hypothetical protein
MLKWTLVFFRIFISNLFIFLKISNLLSRFTKNQDQFLWFSRKSAGFQAVFQSMASDHWSFSSMWIEVIIDPVMLLASSNHHRPDCGSSFPMDLAATFSAPDSSSP